MNRSAFFYIFLLFSFSAFSQKKNNFNLLFIGNSYTFANTGPGNPEVPLKLAELAQLNGKKLVYDFTMRGGKSLRWHWNEGQAITKVKSGKKYDYIILQDFSLMTVLPDSLSDFKKYLGRYDSLIRTTSSKALLYMTWGRQHRPAMIDTVADHYLSMGNKLNIPVVKNGLAWKYLAVHYPHLNLYHDDKSHANDLGVYLNAAMFYFYLFKEVPSRKMVNTTNAKAATKEEIELIWKLVPLIK